MENDLQEVEEQIVEVLKTIYDPELPVPIYDLGLIYEIKVHPNNSVYIKMTLTAPNCPAAGFLPSEVERRVAEIPDVEEVEVELTFDPPYHRDMMSEAAKLELGLL